DRSHVSDCSIGNRLGGIHIRMVVGYPGLMDVVSDHVRTADRMREELVLRASSRVTILEEFNTIVVPYGFSGRLQRRESDLRLVRNVFRVLVRRTHSLAFPTLIGCTRTHECTSVVRRRFDPLRAHPTPDTSHLARSPF